MSRLKSNINPITVWSFSNCITSSAAAAAGRTDVQNKCRACHSQLGRTRWVLMGAEQQDACTQIRSAAIYKLGHGLWTTAEFITASSLRNPATSESNTLLPTPTSALSERSLHHATLICAVSSSDERNPSHFNTTYILHKLSESVYTSAQLSLQ